VLGEGTRGGGTEDRRKRWRIEAEVVLDDGWAAGGGWLGRGSLGGAELTPE
jgi:hypothetical protein